MRTDLVSEKHPFSRRVPQRRPTRAPDGRSRRRGEEGARAASVHDAVRVVRGRHRPEEVGASGYLPPSFASFQATPDVVGRQRRRRRRAGPARDPGSHRVPWLSRLPLRVLEPLARARLAVLLALLLPRVAREEAGALDDAALLRVERRGRARCRGASPRPGRPCRRRCTSPTRRTGPAASMSSSAWRSTMRDVSRSKYSSRGLAVDGDGAGAGLEPDAGDGGLALAGGVRAGVGGHVGRVLSSPRPVTTSSGWGFCAACG